MAQGRPITAADPSPPYLGQVATRCAVPGDINTTNKEAMARECFVARDDIVNPYFEFPNWHCKSAGGEQGSGGTMTLYASLEYPLGSTPVAIYFDGLTVATIADLTTKRSDAQPITIPRGAQFAVKTFQQNAAGVIFAGGRNSGFSLDTDREGFTSGVSGVTNNTLTTTNPTASTSSYGPCAIIAMTRRPSLFLSGDSRLVGIHEDSVAAVPTGAKGEVERSIAKELAYINGATSGDRVSVAVGSYTRRLALAAYCSHIICNYGINDIQNGNRDRTQVMGDLTTLYGMFGAKPIWQLTLTPYSSSTDGWATVENQSIVASGKENTRAAVNRWIRRTPPPLAGHFDVTDIVESGRDSGFWKPNYTDDGIHEVSLACLAIEQSYIIDVRAFSRTAI